MRRKHVLAALGLTVLLAIAALLRSHSPEEEQTETEVRAKTTVVEVKTLEVDLESLGTVQAQRGHVAEISAPDASRVKRIDVAIGDRVAAGQPLMQLDATVWAAKRREAEAALKTAEQASKRAKRLLSEGISPRKDVEAATAELAGARANLEEARRIEQLGTLRSPINGVVVELNASLSHPVETTQLLVKVVDPLALEILFHLSAADAGRVIPGAEVQLKSGEETEREIVGAGTIEGVSAAVDSQGTVDVRASITTSARALKVGEVVTGMIVVAEHPDVVVVPLDALVPDGEHTQVFVVDQDGIAHSSQVTVGTRTQAEAEILSGLKGGETIVSAGAYGVTDGAKILASE